MSEERSQAGSSSNNGHIYGFPNRSNQDIYTRNIIDHTSQLFQDHHLPHFFAPKEPNDLSVEGGNNINPSDGDLNDNEHLDDFDRDLLGRPRESNQLGDLPFSNPNTLPSHGSRGSRLSLPLGNPLSRPTRVLGDASHHFRPYVQHDPEYQSPFVSNPLHVDRLHPSPASQPIFGRDGSHRVKALQPGTQLVTPPFYQPSNPSLPTSSMASASSSSEPSHSSPSMRMSLRRQAQPAVRPTPSHKWSERLQLDLDHARNTPPPVISNTRLIDPRQALPDKFRAVFPYQLFNVVQSKCFPLVYGTNDNVVISAPTGSGKTAILELAICKLVGGAGGENFKVIYQAPTKSLCSERARDWEKKFSHMNLRCAELTGDTSRAQASRVGSASIIVTTPEKWDSITRKWSDHQKLLQMVRLVLIDEVHILADTRGATLEAVVSRMKTIRADVRFVALSATVPNIEDIAKWLGRDTANQHEPARFETFGEELRPVRMQKYVYGYDGSPNEFIFDKSLDGKLNLLLAKHSEKKPIIVFCFTRKSCESTAKCLAEWWSTCTSADKAWTAPSNRIPVISKELQEIVRYGVAFHHGGLGLEDRTAVEQHYLKGELQVICCTSTLAVGVNLPCHTVVLKGTMGYSEGQLQEYSDLDVMQMLGRAGRPQFDKSAVALIMTRRDKADRYNKMIKGQQTLESTLHRNLTEHLNSEIGLGTIQDIATAKKWIGGTFLSVRMRQAPSRYGAEDVLNAAGADERMQEWCDHNIKLLQEHGLITTAPFGCTEYGKAMSRYMVEFETMKLLLTISRGAKLEEMLTILSKASEFQMFRFKPAERALFRKLNQSPFILHPIKETINQTWHKVSLVVQIHLGGVELPNDKEFGYLKREIACEKASIFDRLNRLVRCVVDCKAFDGDGPGMRVGLELARAIAANSWENKPTQLNQIPGFGPVTVRKWISHGVRTVLGVADRDFMDIERISGRNPPYGMNLLKILDSFPRLTLRAEVVQSPKGDISPQDNITVMVKANLGHCNTKRMPNWNGKVPAVTFMVEVSDGSLAYFWRGNIKKIDQARGLELKFPTVLSGPDQTISCYFSCEEIVGTQMVKVLEPQIPASAFTNTNAQTNRRERPTLDILDSDFDDVGDAEMLNALNSVGLGGEQASPEEYPGPLDEMDDGFPLIDDLLSQDASRSAEEPQRMENGRWMCHHNCRNGRPTKSGKPCTHKCCHEGIDKRRPPPQRRKAKEVVREGTDRYDAVESLTYQREMHGVGSSKSKQGKAVGRARSESSSTNYSEEPDMEPKSKSSQPVSRLGHSKPGRPSLKRARSSEGESITKTSKKAAPGKSSPEDIFREAECIDLTMEPDDVGVHKSTNVQKFVAERDKRRERSQTLRRPQGEVSTPIRNTIPVFGSAFSRDSVENPDFDPSITIHENAGAQYDAGDPVDNYELPDIEELIGLSKAFKSQSSQGIPGNDETLHLGVIDSFKESMDQGQEPDLSFTTVEELQKARQRLDISPTSNRSNLNTRSGSSVLQPSYSPREKSDQALPAIDLMKDTSNDEHTRAEGNPDEPASNTVHDNQPLYFSEDPFRVLFSTYYDRVPQPQPKDPDWLSEFDPEIIDSLRGCFNFVD